MQHVTQMAPKAYFFTHLLSVAFQVDKDPSRVKSSANPHCVSDPLPGHCGITVALDSSEP